MKVFYENQWCIERDDGTTIRLSWNESGMLRNAMQRAWIWDEVVYRFQGHPQHDEIEEAKEEIIDDISDSLFYEDDNIIQDAVWSAVEKWVDLDDPEDKMDGE